MGVKMNLRIITKNHAPDPEIGFLIRSISKRYGLATAMPPVLELNGRLPDPKDHIPIPEPTALRTIVFWALGG